MFKKFFLLFVVAAGIAGFFILTEPNGMTADELPAHAPDPENGKVLFYAGGCASCHAAPGATGAEKLKLAGGLGLDTPFGLFRVPNISPDAKTGIGAWSTLDFVNAMTRGVAPDGRHYYPAFPYTSYARMTLEDVIDLKAFLDTLPVVENDAGEHALSFPFTIRRGLGLWKLLHLDPRPVVALPDDAPAALLRGRYLVEGPGHCGECHTPRDDTGGLVLGNWLAGARNLDGKGMIPNITPGPHGIGDWTEEEIASSLESGFKPDFDSFGGSMVAVQENMAHLSPADRAAIAAYLKAVPPRPGH